MQLGYDRVLSRMEQTVLAVVALGPPEAEPYSAEARYYLPDLVELLGIGERVTVDLVDDLWHKGYLAVDMRAATVAVTDEVRRHAREGTLDRLDAAQVDTQEWRVMVDGLTGALLPEAGPFAPPEGGVEVPADHDSSADGFSQVDLLRATRATAEARARGGAPGAALRHVLGAHVPDNGRSGLRRRRWRTVEAALGWDDAADRLIVELDDRDLSAADRERAELRIAELVESAPQSEFARKLRGRVDHGFTGSIPLPERIARFREEAAALAGTAPQSWEQRHEGMREEARAIAGRLRGLAATRVRVEALDSAEEHHRALGDLFDQARDQLVLVWPVLRYDGLNRWFEALRLALERQVRVVLLWGAQHDATLESRAWNMLIDLRRSYPGRFEFGRRSSRVNTTAAIADDRAALVTGCPLPQRPQEGVRQAGVVLSAPSAGPCPPIESLLSWAVTVVPDHRVGGTLSTRHHDFSPAGGEEEAPWEPDLQPEPARPGNPLLWRDGWTSYADDLKDSYDALPSPRASTVLDGQHRDMLWKALRSARRQLVIGCSRLDARTLDRALLEELRARHGDGAQVTLVHPGPADNRSEAGKQANRALQECRRYVRALKQRSNARFVAFDDELLVGGFDPLTDQRTSAGARHLRRFGVGVRITGREAVDAFVENLTRQLPPLPPPRSGAAPSEDAARFGTDGSRLDHDLSRLGTGGPAARARLIRERIAELRESGGDRVLALLAQLHAAGFPAADMRIAVAEALRGSAPEERGTPRFRPWWGWLLSHLWEQGDFAAAAVLRSAAADPDLRPGPVTATLAALRGTPLLEEHAVTAALTAEEALEPGAAPLPGGRDELVALGVLLSAELLFGAGAGEAREALAVLAEHLGPPWRDLAACALEHRQAERDPGAVPLDALDSAVAVLRTRAGVDRDWARLLDLVESTSAVHLDFTSGRRTHQALFRSDGAFGVLLEAVRAHDGAAVAAWAREHPEDSVDDLVDRTTRDLPGTKAMPRIDAARRRGYVDDKLKVISRLAAQVAAEDRTAPPVPGLAPQHEEAVHRLAGGAERWLGAVRDVAEPERHLVRRALGPLELIREWSSR
ncbi:phospholipase D-like domain-containing protein [Nocardiopsis potens]|uniref:hypothetical protein n=1 Tax=Nocardiopsis potens TaxID=1246458 RepID=UPI000349E422|nr:hypothetical protein [Nocardiopsis potens]